MSRRIAYTQAALWGAFTSAGVIAITYLAHDIFGLPEVASDLFEFVSRILPGPIVIPAIEWTIKLVTALKLGPTAASTKQAEQVLAVVEFLVLGELFGLVVSVLWQNGRRRLMLFGASGGLALSAISMLIADFLGFKGAAPIHSLIWLLFIYTGWGLILSRLISAQKSSSVLTPAQPREPQTIPVENSAASGDSVASEAIEPSSAVQPPADVEPPGAIQPAGADQPVGAGRMPRRQFLLLVIAGVLTAVLSALRISSQRAAIQTAKPTSSPLSGFLANDFTTSGPAQSPPETVLEARFPPVTGTRLELTPPENFYRVDINLEPPQVNAQGWQLLVDGLVDHPLKLTLADLRSRPAYSQAVTLECISNGIGGDLISSSVWSGMRLKDILKEAGLQADAREVYIESADGFYESVGQADFQDERTLLVYAMDGQPLTAAHGFPLRIYIPNRYGMKQPKWINHLKAIADEQPGYWVERGWNAQAIVQTTSVIDTVDVKNPDPNNGRIPLGGIAYAGARGISKVEIQVDDHPWQIAELRDPPLSPLNWVQWRYFWQPSPGEHILRVRATDGAGELQTSTVAATFPAGATGYHTVTVKI
jgi:DMSO/TMAO reductase YedYZ molybdopterin-dependent catalytic subunit